MSSLGFILDFFPVFLPGFWPLTPPPILRGVRPPLGLPIYSCPQVPSINRKTSGPIFGDGGGKAFPSCPVSVLPFIPFSFPAKNFILGSLAHPGGGHKSGVLAHSLFPNSGKICLVFFFFLCSDGKSSGHTLWTSFSVRLFCQ